MSLTLGGSATADVPLPDRSLAPCQAQLSTKDGERWHLEARAAGGGLQVNDVVLGEGSKGVALEDGDRILIGGTRLQFFRTNPLEPAGAGIRLAPLPNEPPVRAVEDDRRGPGSLAVLCLAALAVGLAVGLVVGIVLGDWFGRPA